MIIIIKIIIIIVWCCLGQWFWLSEFGRPLSATTGIVNHESAFLFQLLSIALQQYNEVCIRGTFSAAQDDDFD